MDIMRIHIFIQVCRLAQPTLLTIHNMVRIMNACVPEGYCEYFRSMLCPWQSDHPKMDTK